MTKEELAEAKPGIVRSLISDEQPEAADLAAVLDEIATEVRPMLNHGRLVERIPALADVAIDHFGMALQTVDGDTYDTGDAIESFSIQSISKLFTLTMALQLESDALWSRVGREPTRNPFNSLGRLEQDRGIPVNPFVNAGALVIVDTIMGHFANADDRVIEFVRSVSGNADIQFNDEVAHSERENGHRNAALAYLLRDSGNLEFDVDDVLESYFRYCSLEMSCSDLVRAFQYLAQGGRSPLTGEAILTPSLTKRTNALMLTAGVYADTGDFAYRVGLPAKSGVGGGIVAVMPRKWCAAVWSPGLNRVGNSLAGSLALELLTTKTGSSVF